MITLGLLLLALALGDLVSGGLGGEPHTRRRAWIGLAVATAVAVAGAAWFLADRSGVLRSSALTLAATSVWLISKLPRQPDGRGSPRLALSVFSIAMVTAVFLADAEVGAARLDAWLARSPFGLLETATTEDLVLLVGIMLFLTAPANAIVRAVLTIAGTRWERSAQTIRGGRFIGVLERWLIFGLAVAGEPTAAALVVSAKSLLRFPELSRVSRESPAASGSEPAEIDTVTEYFLLGSLLSWTLALAAALLVLDG